MRAPGLVLLITVTACARTASVESIPRWSADLAALRLDGEFGLVDTVATGVLHRSFLVRQGPWAVHVLDVDRNACWTPVAAKGRPGATGRFRTSELAALVAQTTAVAGAVNADFFLFAPPGVPTGAHVRGGALVTGPAGRPAFAITTEGQPWIGTLSVVGAAVSARDSIPVVAWNRVAPDGLAWFDSAWGAVVDTLTGSARVVVSGRRGSVISADTSLALTRIPWSGGVLVLGPRAPSPLRGRLLRALRPNSRVEIDVRLTPLHPREVVGGFPILVRDSMEVPGLDSAGSATFAPARHPRTVVGVASGGRRLFLITIDGRQPGSSVGTTLRESAQLALALGATEAINLDGGGSTTMVVTRQGTDTTRFEVVNKPSDPQGERAVGNALVIARTSAPGARHQAPHASCALNDEAQKPEA
jgi:hypothetical protein